MMEFWKEKGQIIMICKGIDLILYIWKNQIGIGPKEISKNKKYRLGKLGKSLIAQRNTS